MPPRRSRKVGLKRIDAALDAVRPMGFSDSAVRKTVRNLLKAYGGDDGWCFIEEGSYQVLVDSLLEESERGNSEPNALMGSEPKLLTCGSSQDHSPRPMGILPCSSGIVAANEILGMESQSSETPMANSFAPCPSVIAPDKKLVMEDHSSETPMASSFAPRPCEFVAPGEHLVMENHSETPMSSSFCSPALYSLETLVATSFCSPPPVDWPPLRSRRPYYGWIDSDDEEPELVYVVG
ncbi:hypothetical protein Tsubulata_011643 [Turnera subulata]|uniref:WIYLD domain-containing protein n=1 Tax=Turnera subulata TaxID=218843 RepID=A0A9Q0F039_9ROSI|nr:hypothetical protein Tsubulata_011643 [Turnera subulata]